MTASNDPGARLSRQGVLVTGVCQLIELRLCNNAPGCPVAAGKAVFAGMKGFIEVVIYDQRARLCLPQLEGGWFKVSLPARMPRGGPQLEDARLIIRDLKQVQRVPPPDGTQPPIVLGLGTVGDVERDFFTNKPMVAQQFETKFERNGQAEVKKHVFHWLFDPEDKPLATALQDSKSKLVNWRGTLVDVPVVTKDGGFETRAAIAVSSISPIEEAGK